MHHMTIFLPARWDWTWEDLGDLEGRSFRLQVAEAWGHLLLLAHWESPLGISEILDHPSRRQANHVELPEAVRLP